MELIIKQTKSLNHWLSKRLKEKEILKGINVNKFEIYFKD